MSLPRSTIASRPRSGVQRYRLQNPVRSPKNQSDPSGAHVGWPIDSRSSPRPRPCAAAVVVDDEAGGVPRHVGVVPLEPAERAAVRRPARVGHEVGTLHHDLGRARLVGGEPHDRVGRLAAVGVVLLLDAEERGAVGVHVAVGVAEAAGHLGLRGERHRRAARLEPVEALRRPVGEPQHAAAHPPGTAAVLVHRRAGAVLGGQHLVDRAVGADDAARRCGRPPPGRPSDHHTSSPSTRTPLGRRAERTTSSLVIGVGHDPYGSRWPCRLLRLRRAGRRCGGSPRRGRRRRARS